MYILPVHINNYNSNCAHRLGFGAKRYTVTPSYTNNGMKDTYTGNTETTGTVLTETPEKTPSVIESSDKTIIDTVVENYNKTYNEVMTLAEKVNKKASEIQREAEEQAQEVKKLYEQGEEYLPDGTSVRTITKYKDGSGVMTEYDKDGNIKRKTWFYRNGTIVSNIQEDVSHGKVKREFRFSSFENGHLSDNEHLYEYSENDENASRDIGIIIFFRKTTAKVIGFDGEKLVYEEGDSFGNHKIERAKKLTLINGMPSEYKEGIMESDRNQYNTFLEKRKDKVLSFNDDKSTSLYGENIEYKKDGSIKRGVNLSLIDGRPEYIVIAGNSNSKFRKAETEAKCYINTSNGWRKREDFLHNDNEQL